MEIYKGRRNISRKTLERGIELKETIGSTIEKLTADLKKYDNYLKSAGFWVAFSYRIRRLRKYGSKINTIFLPLDILLGMIASFVSDTKIPSSIKVGKGFYLPHPNGVIFNHMCEIGENVSIFQQVTIGEWRNSAPIIKNNVAVFAGAKIFGGITIGDNVKIGANCVVNENIESNSVVALKNMIIKVEEKKDNV